MGGPGAGAAAVKATRRHQLPGCRHAQCTCHITHAQQPPLPAARGQPRAVAGAGAAAAAAEATGVLFPVFHSWPKGGMGEGGMTMCH